MYMGNVKCRDDLQNLILQSIRSLGMKHRYKKIHFKCHEDARGSRGDGMVFKRPLHNLKTELVTLKSGANVEIPRFVAEACLHIRQYCSVEGIFRKAGSSARARDIKSQVDSGSPLEPQHHVIDVSNILKLFLRELPEPLLPFSCHDLLLSCLLLKEKAVDGILLACLLFPSIHLNTLAYLMEFFKDVSDHEDENKMSITNLAIIITPTIMPVEEKHSFHNGIRLSHHVKVIECLIQNNSRIGFLPSYLVDKAVVDGCLLNVNDTEQSDESKLKKKKKRRSGSLTRMFNGLKKMVGKGSPDVIEGSPASSGVSSPCPKSAKKRKVQESASSSFSSKKKRDILGTPCTPLPAAISELYHTPKIRTQPAAMYGKAKTPQSRQVSRKFFTPKPRAESFMSVKSECRTKMQLRQSVNSGSAKKVGKTAARKQRILNKGFYADKERRISQDWKMNSSRESVTGPDSDFGCASTSIDPADAQPLDGLFNSDNESTFTANFESGIDLSDNDLSPENTEFVKIPKSEYEEIKNRVSAIENRLSIELNCFASDPNNLEDIPLIDASDDEASSTKKVQYAYEKALEESEKFTDANSADLLAKRLSKELKIRHSLENKVIRSPSARKIGTIRRRSRDRSSLRQSGQGQPVCPRSALKRGRPNTVFSGLPQPYPARGPAGPADAAATASCEDTADGFPREVRKAYSFHCSNAPANDDNVQDKPCIKKSVSESDFVHSPSCSQTPNSMKDKEHWENAQRFFKTNKGFYLPLSGRESVVKIRNQNAGMVLARTRLFDRQRAPDAPLRSGETSPGMGNENRNNSLRIKCIQDNFLNRLSSEMAPVAQQDHVFVTPSSKQASRQESPQKIGTPRKKYSDQKSPASHRQKLKTSNCLQNVEKVVRFSKENKVHRFCSLRMRSCGSPVSAKVNDSAPASAFSGKENMDSEKNIAALSEANKMITTNRGDVLKQIHLPDNLKETIYDVCTPKTDKLSKLSISPLKDSNRIEKTCQSTFEHRRVNSTLATGTTPFIKQPLLARTPSIFPHTPHGMVTPVRALHSFATPQATPLRHSPRLAAALSRSLVLKS